MVDHDEHLFVFILLLLLFSDFTLFVVFGKRALNLGHGRGREGAKERNIHSAFEIDD